MKTYLYAAASVLIFTSSAFVMKTAATSWKIADKYSVKFDAGESQGIFKGLKGTIKFDDADLAGSSMDVTIDTKTINTGNAMMNKHAVGKEWLDAATYPTIRFVSSSFTKTATGYEAKGKITMKGVTKEVALPFTFTANTFKGSITVPRKDFNITTDGIDDKVKVSLNVPVKK